MTQNINVKKDAKNGLRKAMVPIGIIAAIFGLLFVLINTVGFCTNDFDIMDKITKAARYIAMPACFLTLALAALMLTHGIMQLAKLNKTTVKWEITSGIINTIVGVLMFVSFIVIIITVFNNDKWFEEETGANIWKNNAFMGIITALSIYAACLGKHFNNGTANRNTNIKMLKVISVSALVIALCNILPVLLTCIGGFSKEESLSEPIKQNTWMASSMAAKFAIAAFGTIALGILCMIPLAILGISDKEVQKKNIIAWSVVGGIAFVLFLIPAIMMNLDHGYPKSWMGGDDGKLKNIVISVFVLLAEIYSIVAAGIAHGKIRKLIPNTKLA